jgi:hypothetical protein
MKVCDLVRALSALPDQDAIVVIGEGGKPEVWLLVSGVVERQISRIDEDQAVSGTDAAIEIV